MKLRGRVFVKGKAEGELVATSQPISFLGGVDPQTGTVRDGNHELNGVSLRGKVFAVPWTVGSSVGAYIIYGMALKGTGPSGIVTLTGDINLVSGCAVSGIPLIAGIDPAKLIRHNGSWATLDAEAGYLSF
jgi:predicted aconitase with swiveling domain